MIVVSTTSFVNVPRSTPILEPGAPEEIKSSTSKNASYVHRSPTAHSGTSTEPGEERIPVTPNEEFSSFRASGVWNNTN